MSSPKRHSLSAYTLFNRLVAFRDWLGGMLRPKLALAERRVRLGVEGLESRDLLSVFNPAAAFSASSNTSGPWSYGSANSLAGSNSLRV